MSDQLHATPVHDGKVSAAAILAWIQEWADANHLSVPSDLDQTFDDAGFDSMHSVELAFFLEERLKIKIDDTVLYDYPTFASLAAHLVSRIEPAGAGEPPAVASPGQPAAGAGGW